METQNITISSDDWTQIANDTQEFIATSIVISYEIAVTSTNAKPGTDIRGHVVDSDYSLSRGQLGTGFIWAKLRHYTSGTQTAEIAISK